MGNFIAQTHREERGFLSPPAPSTFIRPSGGQLQLRQSQDGVRQLPAAADAQPHQVHPRLQRRHQEPQARGDILRPCRNG